MAEKPKKKCLGRFETTYMKTMAAPAASEYPPRTRDYGQYVKVLNKIEMNKKFQFPTGLPKYRYDFCGEKYPVPGQKKKPPKPPLNYKPSCPQYAPYHSIMQDMSLVQRRLDTDPEQKHTWYRDKKPPTSTKALDDLFKPRTSSPVEEKERKPERSFNRLQRIQEELEMQEDDRHKLAPYYDRLHTPETPKERKKMPALVEKKRKQPPPPPCKPPQGDRIVIDTSRSSKDATTYGFANSMMLKAGAMLSPPQKDPRAKPKDGVHNFFARGSSDLTSENGTAMAECFYAHARPWGGSLLTLRAEKALNSRYF